VNAFIIGAGFTKAAIPNSPLNDELIEALARKKPNSAARAVGESYKTNNIEIALTKFDCDIQNAPQSSDDRNIGFRRQIETEVGDYFSSSSFCASEKLLAENPWLASLIDQTFKTGDVVISLNYDCVLEGALDYRGKWTPNGGYGSIFEYPVLSDNFPKSPITVLKNHGSASFRNPTGTGLLAFAINEHFFPRSGKNFNFSWSGDEGPYLIAPSYVKVPKMEIAQLMLEALTASAKADNLVIIGSALRKEDSFLTLITTSFLPDLRWNKRRIIIVDPAAESIGQRLEDYWDVNLSDQVIPIRARLQESITRLVQLISASPER
jgi:hypothetical protein